MEVNLTKDMYYFSNQPKPCTDLEVGWCNVRKKVRLRPKEMMIAAYHNGEQVYAYKGVFNMNIDPIYYPTTNRTIGINWQGAILLPPVTPITDLCTRSKKAPIPPIPKDTGELAGLVFDKQYTSRYTDTIQGNLTHPIDNRWWECQLPSKISRIRQSTQMTMAIYVR